MKDKRTACGFLSWLNSQGCTDDKSQLFHRYPNEPLVDCSSRFIQLKREAEVACQKHQCVKAAVNGGVKFSRC